ncbi:MAG: cytochrome P450 [Gemmatimonadaceae bacterium]
MSRSQDAAVAVGSTMLHTLGEHTAPGVRARYPGEFALEMVRRPLEFLTGLAREHGDVVHYRLGTEHMYLLSHPEAIRDVLVTNQRNFKKGRALERAKILLGEGLLTSEGDLHLRQRRLMQPAFHRQRIAAYGDTMVAYATRRAKGWKDGQSMNVHEEMMALTLAIVGKTLFDADVEGEARDIGDALSDAFTAFNAGLFMPYAKLLERLPLPATRRFKRGRARLERTIYRIIAERRQSGADAGDLLSMLLHARDEDGDGTGMSDTQIRDEALTLFIAGHETTAVALSWTWYLLAQHPEVEEEFHHELDALRGATLNAESLIHLPYTRQILTESMRLYPPAWIVGRRALGAFETGGYHIPERSIVVMSQWVTHRDRRWFPEPERFDPDRWLPGQANERPKFSYFPFGGGSRLCIGEPFAWMEGVLLLAEIGRRWRFRLASRAPVEPRATITLRPRNGIAMRAELRHDIRSGT